MANGNRPVSDQWKRKYGRDAEMAEAYRKITGTGTSYKGETATIPSFMQKVEQYSDKDLSASFEQTPQKIDVTYDQGNITIPQFIKEATGFFGETKPKKKQKRRK